MKKRKNDLIETAANEATVRLVRGEYERRESERRSIEAQWQLNACFVAGRQYAYINPVYGVDERSAAFEWEERQVYNHTAPIYESRLAKLDRVRPIMSVRPAGASDDDLKIAKASTKILSAVSASIDLPSIIGNATMWSELTGSVFYKLVWEGDEKSGGAKVIAVPPYEIYPESLSASNISEQRSIIHARAVPVSVVEELYDVTVPSERVQIAMPERNGATSTPDLVKREPSGYVTLIEMYVAPNNAYPDGQLHIVAGNKLLYSGILPYTIGSNGARCIPFVKQDSIAVAGSFFGTCMIDRVVPLQRALNAVKNRKHEFMSRLAVGVLAVEDGAVDTEDLEVNGLAPGKILVYRQGSTPPHMLSFGSVPSIFQAEEDKLLSEMSQATGVSEMMRSSAVPSSVTSGTAIAMLIEQDETRLTVTAEHIRTAVKQISQFIIRIYKQFAKAERLNSYVGEDGAVELLKWKGSDLGEGDIVFETSNELANTQATRQSMLFDLMRMGLFNDERGKMSDDVRHKILSAVGYGSWESMQGLQNLHILKADKENLAFGAGETREPDEIDEHSLHIAAHTRYMLSNDFEECSRSSPEIKEAMLAHIRSHRLMDSMTPSSGEAANAV